MVNQFNRSQNEKSFRLISVWQYNFCRVVTRNTSMEKSGEVTVSDAGWLVIRFVKTGRLHMGFHLSLI